MDDIIRKLRLNSLDESVIRRWNPLPLLWSYYFKQELEKKVN